MLCALIRDSLVVGIVDLSDDDFASGIAGRYEAVIDITSLSPQPQIGWSFDGQNISGSSVSLRITKLAMNQRFTVTEMIGLLSYVNSNPASIVALLLQRLQIATYVDLSRTDTQAGIGVLVSYNLLTQDRATAILTTVPTALELYTGS